MGLRVSISDAAHLRGELRGFEDKLEETVLTMAGRRGIVTKKPKTRLDIVEAAGRVEVRLVEKDCRALLPVTALWPDEKFLEMETEMELAKDLAAVTLQEWWRDQLYSKVLDLWQDRLKAQRAVEKAEIFLRRLYEKNAAMIAFQAAKAASFARRASEREQARGEAALVKVQSRVRRSSAVSAAAVKRQEVEQEHRQRRLLETKAATTLQSMVFRPWGARRRVVQFLQRRQVDLRIRQEQAAAFQRDQTDLLEELYTVASEGGQSFVQDLAARARTLFSEGIDVSLNVVGDDVTAFALACGKGHLATARALCDAGADPDKANGTGWTALHRASFGGHVTVVRWLGTAKPKPTMSFLSSLNQTSRGAGADLGVGNAKGSSAAHACVPGGHVRLLRLLSDVPPEGFGRSDLLARPNLDGDTPLHFAIMCRQLVVARCLLNRKVPAGEPNNDGLTPLDLAEKCGEHAIAALIRNALGGTDDIPTALDDEPVVPSKKKKKKPKQPKKPSRTMQMKRCATLRQALALAWKFASDEIRTINLRRRDVAVLLTGLGVMEEHPEEDDDESIVIVDVTVPELTARSLIDAAEHLEIPLTTTAIPVKRARAAQKRLLECVRSPPEALRQIHDNAMMHWTTTDVERFLMTLKVPLAAIPEDFRGGPAFLGYASAPDDISECPSTVGQARLRFHLSIIRYLAALTHQQRGPSAGSGAAHALAVQRSQQPLTPEVVEDPSVIVYRPTQDFSAFQRAEEMIQKESPRRPPQERSRIKGPRSVRISGLVSEAPVPATSSFLEPSYLDPTATNEIDAIAILGVPAPFSPPRSRTPLFRPTSPDERLHFR